MKSVQIRQELGILHTEERGIMESLGGDSSKATDAQIERMAAIDLAINNQKTILRAAERQEQEERTANDALAQKEIVERATADPKTKDGMEKKVFHAYLRGATVNDFTPEEKVLFSKAQERGQTIGVPGKGGFATPQYFSNEVIKAMKFFGGVLDLAKVITTTDGNVINFTAMNDTANVAVPIAEVAAAGNTELDFTRVTLGANKYTSNVFRVSNELLTDSIIDMESEIVQAIAERFARGFNADFTNASTAGKPQGILSGTTIGVGAAAAAAVISYADLVNLVYSVDKAYRGNATLMFSDSTEAVLRKLVDAQGRPLWSIDDMVKGSPAKVLGHSYVVNNDMPAVGAGAKSIIFGDFSKGYRVRMVNDIAVARLNELFALSDEVGFVSFMRIDGKIFDANALKVLKHA